MRDKKTWLYYIEEGEKNDEIIIFLHSKNLANWIWDEQLDSFKDYHCIYLNLPNHFKNSKKEVFSIKKASDIIKDFILEHKKTDVNLVGIGLGGQIAIEILSKYPELINKVIVSGVEVRDKNDCKSYKDSIVNVLDETKAILDSKTVGFLTIAYLRHYDLKKSYYKKMFLCCEKGDLENTKRISFESFNYCLNRNPKNSSKEILICYGTKEDRRAKISSKEIKSIYPNSEIVEIERGVHLWNMKKPALFNQIVIDFLND